MSRYELTSFFFILRNQLLSPSVELVNLLATSIFPGSYFSSSAATGDELVMRPVTLTARFNIPHAAGSEALPPPRHLSSRLRRYYTGNPFLNKRSFRQHDLWEENAADTRTLMQSPKLHQLTGNISSYQYLLTLNIVIIGLMTWKGNISARPKMIFLDKHFSNKFLLKEIALAETLSSQGNGHCVIAPSGKDMSVF